MKKPLTIFLIVTVCFALSGTSYSQSDKPVKLLEQWFGIWKGDLHFTTSEGKTSEMNMSLVISETETPGEWNWNVKYGEAFSQDYILRKVDSEKGIYILDDNNSILIDCFFLNNTFYSTFSSSGSLAVSKYQLRDNEINFELITSNMNSANITNNKTDENTLVYSYPVFVIQTAVLKKD